MTSEIAFKSQLASIIQGFSVGHRIAYDLQRDSFVSSRILSSKFRNKENLSFDQEIIVDKIINLIEKTNYSFNELLSLQSSIHNRLTKLELQGCSFQNSFESSPIQMKINQYNRCLDYLINKIRLVSSRYNLLKQVLSTPGNSNGLSVAVQEEQPADRICLSFREENLLFQWDIQEKSHPDLEDFYIGEGDNRKIDFDKLLYSISNDGHIFQLYYVDSEYELEYDVFFMTINLTSPTAAQEIKEAISAWKNSFTLKLTAFIEEYSSEYANLLTSKNVTIEDFNTHKERFFIECTKLTPFTFEANLVYINHKHQLASIKINLQEPKEIFEKIKHIAFDRRIEWEIEKIQEEFASHLITAERKKEQQEALITTDKSQERIEDAEQPDNFLIEIARNANFVAIWGSVKYGDSYTLTPVKCCDISLENVRAGIQKLYRLREATKLAFEVISKHPKSHVLYYVRNSASPIHKKPDTECCIQPGKECHYFWVRFFGPSSEILFSVQSRAIADLSTAIRLAYLQAEVKNDFPDDYTTTPKKGESIKDFLYSPISPLELYDMDKVVIKFEENGYALVLRHIDLATRTVAAKKMHLGATTTYQQIHDFIESVEENQKNQLAECKKTIRNEFPKNFLERSEYNQQAPFTSAKEKTFYIIEETDLQATLAWTICYTNNNKEIKSLRTEGLGAAVVREKIEMIKRFWSFEDFFIENTSMIINEKKIRFKKIRPDFSDFLTEFTNHGFKSLYVLVQPNPTYNSFTFYFLNPNNYTEVCQIRKRSLADPQAIGEEIAQYYDILQKNIFSKQIYNRTSKLLPVTLPETPSSYKLDHFLLLFDAINFGNPSAPDYQNPSFLILDDKPATVAEVRTSLKNLLLFIASKEADIIGLPEASHDREKFYKDLYCLLTHLAEKLDKKNDSYTTAWVLYELAEAAHHCAARWMATAWLYYNELIDQDIYTTEIPLDELFCIRLDKLKINIVKEIILYSDNSQNAHGLLTLCSALKEAGIEVPGAWMSQYNDPYEASGFSEEHQNKEQMVYGFKSKFTLFQVIETIYEWLNEKMKTTPLLVGASALDLLRSYAKRRLLSSHPKMKQKIKEAEDQYTFKKAELNAHPYFTADSFPSFIEDCYRAIKNHVLGEDTIDFDILSANGKVEEILSLHLIDLIETWQLKMEKNDDICKRAIRALLEKENGHLDKDSPELADITAQWESSERKIKTEIKELLTHRLTSMKGQIQQEYARQHMGQLASVLDQLLSEEGFYLFDELNDDGTIVGFTRKAVVALLEETGFVQPHPITYLTIPKSLSRHRLY